MVQKRHLNQLKRRAENEGTDVQQNAHSRPFETQSVEHIIENETTKNNDSETETQKKLSSSETA